MPHQHPVPDDLAPVCAPGCPGHPDALAKVRDELPDEETLYDLAELFRIFAIPPGSRSSTRCLKANSAWGIWPRRSA